MYRKIYGCNDGVNSMTLKFDEIARRESFCSLNLKLKLRASIRHQYVPSIWRIDICTENALQTHAISKLPCKKSSVGRR